MSNSIFQFKITLDNIKPAIWRRIQVTETSTFWDFHVAIQDAMGWYDFGDDWRHTVVLEKVLTADATLKYPVCVDGRRACPPEDCGGVPGYYRLLKIMSNSKHGEYKDVFAWIGGEYDSEYFVPEEVEFSNSKNRLRKLLKSLN